MISDDDWYTAGSFLQWAWARLFTRIGAIFLSIIWISVSWYFGSTSSAGLYGYLAYFVVFPFLLLFSAIMLVICTLVGDAFAGWAARDVLRGKLRQNSLLHQIIYFLISCFGLLIGALIFGMSDSYSVPLIP